MTSHVVIVNDDGEFVEKARNALIRAGYEVDFIPKLYARWRDLKRQTTSTY